LNVLLFTGSPWKKSKKATIEINTDDDEWPLGFPNAFEQPIGLI